MTQDRSFSTLPKRTLYAYQGTALLEVSRQYVLLIQLFVLALFFGCDGADQSVESGPPDADQSAPRNRNDQDANLPPQDRVTPDEGVTPAEPWGPPMPSPGEWIQVEPGQDTLCARGTPYRFFVRGGRSDRVVFFLQGGGACWDELTCSLAGAIFTEEAPTLDELLPLLELEGIGGIFDQREENPFRDWTLLYLPYCSGDIYWGDARADYTPTLSIEHRGFVNVSRVLEWLGARLTEPERILSTGCSAGAYGSVLHGVQLADRYPGSEVAVLADSGAGIITETFLRDSFPNWNAQANIPMDIEALQAPPETLSIESVYREIGAARPRLRLSQYTTAFDLDQIGYFTAMGGAEEEWAGRQRESILSIAASTENFRYYLAPGSMHCVLNYDFMFDRSVQGVRFIDWLERLVLGENLPDSVACEGEGCFMDPVCDACLEEGGPGCNFCRGWPERHRN